MCNTQISLLVIQHPDTLCRYQDTMDSSSVLQLITPHIFLELFHAQVHMNPYSRSFHFEFSTCSFAYIIRILHIYILETKINEWYELVHVISISKSRLERVVAEVTKRKQYSHYCTRSELTNAISATTWNTHKSQLSFMNPIRHTQAEHFLGSVLWERNMILWYSNSKNGINRWESVLIFFCVENGFATPGQI